MLRLIINGCSILSWNEKLVKHCAVILHFFERKQTETERKYGRKDFREGNFKSFNSTCNWNLLNKHFKQ